MSRTVNIIAFDDDVRCLNANLTDPLARIARDYGITEPIGPRLSDEPLAPGINLYPHEMTLSADGHAQLTQYWRANPIAKQLRLTEAEAFGLFLAVWRDFYGSAIDGMDVKDHQKAICNIALYKIRLAEIAGDKREVRRLKAARTKMQQEFDQQRVDERQLNAGIRRSLAPNEQSDDQSAPHPGHQR
jgi:hypothetical protein